MNKHILTTTMAALLAGLPLSSADDKASSTKSTVISGADGTVTMTIDINGKKETKTFKLGEGGDKATIHAQAGDGTGNASAAKMVKATWLGVAVNHPLSPELRAQLPLQAGEGIVVSHVAPDSPAAKAGLEQHDVLSRLDEQVLVSSDQFQTLVRMHKPGDKSKVVFYRKGERKEVEVAFVEHEVEERAPGDRLFRIFGGDGGRFPDMKHLPDQVRQQLEKLREHDGELRDRLKDMKEKFPGVIVEKKAIIVGPDGKVKVLGNDLEAIKDAVDAVRNQLKDSDISKETRDQVFKALDAVIDNAGDAAKKGVKGAVHGIWEEWKKNSDKKDAKEAGKTGDLLLEKKEVEKKDDAPAKP